MNHFFEVMVQSILIAISLTIILEFSGRKAFSQLTIIHIVIIIMIGETSIMPFQNDEYSILDVAGITLVLVLFMRIVDWLEMKYNWIEKINNRRAIVIIQNGDLVIENLKKERITIDDLESRLRKLGIANYKELKTATIENNGEIGYEFKDEYSPLNKRDLLTILNREKELPQNDNSHINSFEELISGHKKKNPKSLE